MARRSFDSGHWLDEAASDAASYGHMINGQMETDATSKIKVCVRIRPLLQSESESTASDQEVAWKWSDQHIIQDKFLTAAQAHAAAAAQASKDGRDRDTSSSAYSFDNLFGPDSTNELIYNSAVKQLVHKTVEGFHGTIFAYGQTSSGKTFTMNGDANNVGIISQSIYECFELIDSTPEREFKIKISYMEVYNEQVRDLLNSEPTVVKILSDGNRVILSGVKEVLVTSPDQVISLLEEGEMYRSVGATDMNEHSSRAHSIFRLMVESKVADTDRSGVVRYSTLCLVDLAGSENAKMTNSKGERAREARHINQSLLTLSTIIQRLSNQAVIESRETDRPNSSRNRTLSSRGDWESETNSDGVSSGSGRPSYHLPYRDSKLTRIMQPSLSGNSLIVVICTISPTVRCAEESHNTLKFAQRAKKIKMTARLNEVIDDKTLLRAYRAEMELLRAKLEAALADNGGEETLVRRRVLMANQYSEGTEWMDRQGGTLENTSVMLQLVDDIEKLHRLRDNYYNATNNTSETGENLHELVSRKLGGSSSSSSSNAVNKNGVYSRSRGVIEGKSGLVEGKEGLGLRERRQASENSKLVNTGSRGRSTSRSSTPGRRSLTPGAGERTQSARSSRATTPISRQGGTSSRASSRPSSRASSPVQSSSASASNLRNREEERRNHNKINEMLSTLRQTIMKSAKPKETKEDTAMAMSKTVNPFVNVTTNSSANAPTNTMEIPTSALSFIDMDNADFGFNASADAEYNQLMSATEAAAMQSQSPTRMPMSLQEQEVPMASVADTKRLMLDMRLIGADNRFLQEELEKRDKMLSKLTEGLREVEVVQINYQQENIQLKEELERTKRELNLFLQENDAVGEMRLDLDVVLQENRRLAIENSRLAKYVRELDKILLSARQQTNSDESSSTTMSDLKNRRPSINSLRSNYNNSTQLDEDSENDGDGANNASSLSSAGSNANNTNSSNGVTDGGNAHKIEGMVTLL